MVVEAIFLLLLFGGWGGRDNVQRSWLSLKEKKNIYKRKSLVSAAATVFPVGGSERAHLTHIYALPGALSPL